MPVKRPSQAARPYHHADLPAALIGEALTILDRDGSADFTLRSLARRLGVSHAAPYAHFANKAALLGEIAAAGFERLEAAMAAARDPVPARTATARLEAIGLAYIHFGRSHPALYGLMFGPGIAGAVAHVPRLAAAGGAAYALLVDAVAAVLRRPPGDADVRHGAFAAWASVHGATQLLLGDGLLAPQADGDADRASAAVVRITARGLEASVQRAARRRREHPPA